MRGGSIQAVSQDKDAAALMGIPADRAHAIAFSLSCAITGVAGGILTYYYQLVKIDFLTSCGTATGGCPSTRMPYCVQRTPFHSNQSFIFNLPLH